MYNVWAIYELPPPETILPPTALSGTLSGAETVNLPWHASHPGKPLGREFSKVLYFQVPYPLVIERLRSRLRSSPIDESLRDTARRITPFSDG